MAEQVETATRPKRRQARGERRIEQLLAAAGEVFAESGYSATTTNAIAARAGVSPGTLYQYFPNKDAIADALGEVFAAKLNELHLMLAVDPDDAELPPLAEVLDAAVLTTVRFNRENPACPVLFMGPDAPQRLVDVHAPLHAELLARMGALLGRYAPEVPEDRIRDVAEVTVAAFKGILPLLVAADEQRLPQLVEEMEQLLLGYFSRALGLTT
ncbi:TetR family transcriptional regulator [Streptacidiphilus monticola]|uniref:TetR family transcriptional regulator n=1 Tax=Streptacidiphilus monticola TaxID=2161674 RepID=A0ABW1G3L9_9ACTN